MQQKVITNVNTCCQLGCITAPCSAHLSSHISSPTHTQELVSYQLERMSTSTRVHAGRYGHIHVGSRPPTSKPSWARSHHSAKRPTTPSKALVVSGEDTKEARTIQDSVHKLEQALQQHSKEHANKYVRGGSSNSKQHV